MKILRLTGKTGHGKNRVNEHGDLWNVLEQREHISFPTKSVGPFAMVESLITGNARWVGLTSDENFDIEEVVR